MTETIEMATCPTCEGKIPAIADVCFNCGKFTDFNFDKNTTIYDVGLSEETIYIPQPSAAPLVNVRRLSIIVTVIVIIFIVGFFVAVSIYDPVRRSENSNRPIQLK